MFWFLWKEVDKFNKNLPQSSTKFSQSDTKAYEESQPGLFDFNNAYRKVCKINCNTSFFLIVVN